jgi:acyl carrier protein
MAPNIHADLRNEVTEAVLNLVAGHMGLLPITLNEHQRVQEDLGADAFDQIELVMTVNERFDVNIRLDSAAGLHTVGDLINSVFAELQTNK